MILKLCGDEVRAVSHLDNLFFLFCQGAAITVKSGEKSFLLTYAEAEEIIVDQKIFLIMPFAVMLLSECPFPVCLSVGYILLCFNVLYSLTSQLQPKYSGDLNYSPYLPARGGRVSGLDRPNATKVD